MTPGARHGLSGAAYRVLVLAGVVALLIMVLSTLLAVFARYFALRGVEWSYEVAGIAFVWVTFLGAVVAEVRGENAAFDVLKQSAAPAARHALGRLATGLLGAVGVMLLVSAVAMLQRSALVPTPLLRWPGFVMSGAVPVCGACLCVLAAWRLVRPGTGPRDVPDATPGTPL